MPFVTVTYYCCKTKRGACTDYQKIKALIHSYFFALKRDVVMICCYELFKYINYLRLKCALEIVLFRPCQTESASELTQPRWTVSVRSKWVRTACDQTKEHLTVSVRAVRSNSSLITFKRARQFLCARKVLHSWSDPPALECKSDQYPGGGITAKDC